MLKTQSRCWLFEFSWYAEPILMIFRYLTIWKYRICCFLPSVFNFFSLSLAFYQATIGWNSFFLEHSRMLPEWHQMVVVSTFGELSLKDITELGHFKLQLAKWNWSPLFFHWKEFPTSTLLNRAELSANRLKNPASGKNSHAKDRKRCRWIHTEGKIASLQNDKWSSKEHVWFWRYQCWSVDPHSTRGERGKDGHENHSSHYKPWSVPPPTIFPR